MYDYVAGTPRAAQTFSVEPVGSTLLVLRLLPVVLLLLNLVPKLTSGHIISLVAMMPKWRDW